jgi:hypothetical protein
MTMWLKQSTATTIKFGPLLDATDGITPEAGEATALDNATTGIRLAKNGADIVDRNDATAPVHDEVGYYDIVLDATDTGTLGRLRVIYNGPTVNLPVWQDYMVVPANVWDSMFGADKLDTSVVELNGDATAAANLAVGALGLVYNTAKAGTLSTTQMSTNLTEATDDHYIGRTVVWTTGVLLGQASDVTDYVGVNGVLTFSALTEAPGAGDQFILV